MGGLDGGSGTGDGGYGAGGTRPSAGKPILDADGNPIPPDFPAPKCDFIVQFAWQPRFDDEGGENAGGENVEAIVVTASGCGTTVAEYGYLMRNDAEYAAKAQRISALYRDVSQIIAQEKEALTKRLTASGNVKQRLAFHSPCSLQHGLKIKGVVEEILMAAGYELTNVPDGHLCCGSAGTYSILQTELSQQLLANKVNALESGAPQMIATANIGCLAHIESGLNSSSKTPIRHWIELVDERMSG